MSRFTGYGPRLDFKLDKVSWEFPRQLVFFAFFLVLEPIRFCWCAYI